MSEETRKSYTIRLPERIASWLETNATEAGITPTTLIQSLITRQFETSIGSAKARLAEKPPDHRERSASGIHPDYELRQQQRLASSYTRSARCGRCYCIPWIIR